MSNDSWNEFFLLKRYKLINFVNFNPSFCNYLKKIYLLYKKDLRYNFIPLPIEHKFQLKAQKEHVDMFKSFVLIDRYFVKCYSKLLKIFSNWPPKYNGKVSYFKWKTKLEPKNHKKFVQYTKLFEQISNHIFKRYLELDLSIPTLDKIILSLEIEMPIRFFLIAAFFRYILHCWYNKNEKFIISPNAKSQKVNYKRWSV